MADLLAGCSESRILIFGLVMILYRLEGEYFADSPLIPGIIPKKPNLHGLN